MSTDLREEHRWLERLVGDWSFEAGRLAEPGTAAARQTGTEHVRSLGGVWIVCEARSDTAAGGTEASLMTLGYDPVRARYVGTFVASMMTKLWIYDGAMDSSGNVLTLETEGPSFAIEGATARYRDTIELTTPDHRVMTSSYADAEGRYHRFLTMQYRRTT
jgi:hypothetical protein